MIVNFITKEKILTISLPKPISGKFWITDIDNAGEENQIVSIEGIQGEWFLQSNQNIQLINEEKNVNSIKLEFDNQVIFARNINGEQVKFYIEPKKEENQIFEKYIVPAEAKINIGRTDKNNIQINNTYVSKTHACLVFKDQIWTITDLKSSNGVFVNNKKVLMADIKPGDIVYIMGVKIIIGNNFFAINNPNDEVNIKEDRITKLINQEVDLNIKPRAEQMVKPFFYRSPRFFREIEPYELKIESPPQKEKIQTTPIILLLGPAMTMSTTSLIMGWLAIENLNSGNATIQSVIPTLAMCFSMLCGTMLWPIITKKNEKKLKKESEEKRQKRYREYLQKVRGEIYDVCKIQSEIILENSPSLEKCKELIMQENEELWNRTQKHKDFLKLRLGLGDLKAFITENYQDDKFSMEDDIIIDDMKRLKAEEKILKNIPICASVKDYMVTGIIGYNISEFLKSLIVQITALHSYEEVKIVFITTEIEKWDFIKWLPHTWDNEKNNHYIITNGSEAKKVSSFLENILLERIDPNQKRSNFAHYIIISTDMSTIEKFEIYKNLRTTKEKIGFSCICIAEDMKKLPKECDQIIEIGKEKSFVYNINDISNKKTSFKAEYLENIEEISNVLCNLAIEATEQQSKLPNMITFLDMYNVLKIEHLNVLSRWKNSDSVNSLQSIIGIGQDNKPFYLDLHEKFHGPHGLIAGMTGSGKSEFIITFILSLAINYSPEEVAFVLIDYKGGGLAGAFENPTTQTYLPHIVGTITNLDGANVNRSLISIQSELRKRQSIFNEARNLSGEGTIDIYKYQAMYKEGIVSEPVPHLFIVSDEFAELKTQQPEFMEQLISAARIGRSLGVHLILATQKPSGVVNDQIWSNSRFRVCLKVQEKADSTEMIKRPDAAELVQTGRFYLQVGFNELFEMGQSAWCGAPYILQKNTKKSEIEIIDNTGDVVSHMRTKSVVPKNSNSQTFEIVKYLSEISKGENLKVKKLWLPPISKCIYTKDIRQECNWSVLEKDLKVIIGKYDDPFNQLQEMYDVSLTQDGNLIIYGSVGSGKGLLIDSIICNLITDFSSEFLNMYLIDMGEQTFGIYEDVPQVGDIIFAEEDEKMLNLILMIQKEIEKRRVMFSKYGGSYETYVKNNEDTIPHVLIVIRNYASFSENYENLEEDMRKLMRDGNKYGIYFIIITNSSLDIRYRFSQYFPQIITLQLKEDADYIGVFGSTGGVLPSKIKGRGLVKLDKIYEFQAGCYELEINNEVISELIEKTDKTFIAPRIPILPKKVTGDMFEPTLEKFPIAISKMSIKPLNINIKDSVISVVLGRSLEDLEDNAIEIASQLQRCKETKFEILDGSNIFENNKYDNLTNNNFSEKVEEMFRELVHRNNTYKIAQKENQELPIFENRTYAIVNISAIINSLNEEEFDKFATLIEKTESLYNVNYILFDSDRNLKSQITQEWFKKHINGNDGCFIGSGLLDQSILKVSKTTRDLYSELNKDFGYVISKGKPTLAKFLTYEGGEDFDE